MSLSSLFRMDTYGVIILLFSTEPRDWQKFNTVLLRAYCIWDTFYISFDQGVFLQITKKTK